MILPMTLSPACRKFLVGVCIFLGTCSISQADLTEIETAIIQQDFATAKQLANDYLATQPHPADVTTQKVQYYLALSELNLEEFVLARETFEQIIAHQPDEKLRAKASLGIVDSFYMMGEYKEALNRAEKFLKENRDPEFTGLTYLKIARANLKLTNWGQAKDYLSKILESFPNSVEAHLAKQLLGEKQFFSVQVGSFLDRQRSEKLAGELKSKGEYAYIIETLDFSGQKFYRVRVGQFANLDKAFQMQTKLAQQGYPTRIYP